MSDDMEQTDSVFYIAYFIYLQFAVQANSHY